MKGTAHLNPPSLNIQGKIGRFQRPVQTELPKWASLGQIIDGSDRVPIRQPLTSSQSLSKNHEGALFD